MAHKASFSSSPLAHPRTPIHRLAAQLQNYLHFPDPYPLYAVVGSLVANCAQGRPVWLMLIGPPSCGKSELLNSLLSIPRVVETGNLSGVAALLSGVKRKDRHKDSTGGLLRACAERGAVVIKEFNSILSLPYETMRNVLGAFREIYDGRYTRSTGADGGQDLHWQGKLAVLTGVTAAIDNHHALIAQMGERFIFYRYPQSEGWGEAYQALLVEHSEHLSPTLQSLLSSFCDEIGFDWTSPPELPDLSEHDRRRIVAFAQIGAHGRSAVIRDSYTREVVQSSVGEYPTRLALAFGQLLRALRYIGADDEEGWRLIHKCAFDSIPGNRRRAVRSLMTGAHSTPDISVDMGVSQATARRSLEELEIHRLVARTSPHEWEISNWMKDKLREAMLRRIDPYKSAGLFSITP